MSIKDTVRKSLRRGSPLFQAVYQVYYLAVCGLYNLVRLTTRLDRHLVLFDAFQGRQYTCSPKALYEQMRSDPAYRDYRFLWAVAEEVMDKHRYPEDERTRIVRYNSWAHKVACAKAGYVVTNSMPLGFFRLRKGQQLIETWHGTPLKRLGCDIAVDSNSVNTADEIHKRYRKRVRKMSALLSPSDFYTEKLTSAFDLKGAGKDVRIIQQGYPRNDFLSRFTAEDAAAIKARLGVPEGKKVILYAPTFRDNQKLDKAYSYSFTLEMDFDHLLSTLGENYVILFRPHYFIANRFDFDRYKGRVINVAGVDDVNEVYVISDLLITDYSSVFFDYAILKRPVLLFMYDLELYQGQLRDFYIDLGDLPFPILRKQEELEQAILDQLNGGFRFTEAYARFNQTYTPMDDGKASQRVLKEIFSEK
ncbi:MAG: CDP-glycerol glycerophosphotransferase family protein [Oscillospiraceae bacterium]|nr:CDP-glycerol glycerophosphotransferase family protein [Oscillospiraceae bacterium]